MVSITLSIALLRNLGSSGENYKDVGEAADKGGRDGHQSSPPVCRRKEAANATVGEQRSGSCKSKDSRAGSLYAKVVGPQFKQDFREGFDIDRLDHDDSGDKGLQRRGVSNCTVSMV